MNKKYKIVLWHAELEYGLTKENISKMIELLDDSDCGYMTIELEGEPNSSAYGFICSDYYEELNYDINQIAKIIVPVLEDWNKETDNKEYLMSDGTKIYMGCDYKTV